MPVSRLREALAPLITWLDASAGEGRSQQIMLEQQAKARAPSPEKLTNVIAARRRPC